MRNGRSVWKSRAGILIGLGALAAVLLGVIVYYSVLYDARIVSLQEERARLEKRRDDGRAQLQRVKDQQARLAGLTSDVVAFYSETLGPRKERLPLILEDVYAITKKAGMRPDQISYAEDQVPAGDRLTFSFQVEGRYPEIKKLVAAIEKNQRLLILDTVAVDSADEDPDMLRVRFTVFHYFRSEASKTAQKMVREGTRLRKKAVPKGPR